MGWYLGIAVLLVTGANVVAWGLLGMLLALF
jgi:hypothetical protein